MNKKDLIRGIIISSLAPIANLIVWFMLVDLIGYAVKIDILLAYYFVIIVLFSTLVLLWQLRWAKEMFKIKDETIKILKETTTSLQQHSDHWENAYKTENARFVALTKTFNTLKERKEDANVK